MVLYGNFLHFLHFDIFIWFYSGDTDYVITAVVVGEVMFAAVVPLVVVIMIVVMDVSDVARDLLYFLLIMFGCLSVSF